MRFTLIIIICCIAVISGHAQSGFKHTQQSYARVRDAYQVKGDSLTAMLSKLKLETGEIELYLRAFKQEKIFEIWIRKQGDEVFRKLKSYDICNTSGIPGPKRKQGDLQIPEGFYNISAFNPWSSFHLSMCINYPNPSDRILGVQGNLGGDICIHGSCVTIGCIPLTDDVIKELYLLCIEAKNNGQRTIPVTIFPARMQGEEYSYITMNYADDRDRINLWADLKIAYDNFEEDHRLPEITFLGDGRHSIQ